ncbi:MULTISPECIES: thiolase C-terminal domain-containing protein [Sphingobium]|uniref:thiolase C-terminal domain-containing protein n=1 Tax=Sphingobium TaxID=165695 RepID=UPI00159C6B8C|nr:hypothetical protein [Sphingobium sp. 15-1]
MRDCTPRHPALSDAHCSSVSNEAACAILTTQEIARTLGMKDLVTVKSIQLLISSGIGSQINVWDGSHVRNTRNAVVRANKEAGITDPTTQLGLIEVHDCFSVTELATMGDLFIFEEGRAVKDVLDGFYDAGGQVPCQIAAGLNCFGHPIAAISIPGLGS